MYFIDLKKQQKLIRENIEKRISKVLDHGQYIQGPEVKELDAFGEKGKINETLDIYPKPLYSIIFALFLTIFNVLLMVLLLIEAKI